MADVYDALTSRRSYKDAWDDHEAYDEIVRCSGTQFEPQMVDAFCKRYSEVNAIRERLHNEAWTKRRRTTSVRGMLHYEVQ